MKRKGEFGDLNSPKLRKREREKPKRTPFERVLPIAAALIGTGLPATGMISNLIETDRAASRYVSEEGVVPFEHAVEKTKVEVGGAEVTFLGIYGHDKDTLETYTKQLQEEIRTADVVVLEYFGETEEKISTSENPEKEIQTTLLQVQKFFGGVSVLAAQEGKDIVVVNPENIYKHLLMWFTLLGIPFGVAGEVVSRWSARERTLNEYKPELPWHYPLLAPAILAWALTGTTSEDRAELAREMNMPVVGQVGELGLMIDHRDQVGAEGIRKLIESHPQYKHVVVIQGAAHQATASYLERGNPQRSDILGTLYSQTSGLRYSYDSDIKQWKLVEDFPITPDT